MTFYATAEGITEHLGPFATEAEAIKAATEMGREHSTVYEIDDNNPGESK